MKKLITLASVGVFLLSLQGYSLAQEKAPATPAGPPVLEAPAIAPVETPVTPDAKGTQKTKTAKKKTKKTKTAKKTKTTKTTKTAKTAKTTKTAKTAKTALKYPPPKVEE